MTDEGLRAGWEIFNNEESLMSNGDLLLDAHLLINGDRQRQYGAPKVNFTKISSLWSAFLSMPISPEQVPVMLALMKLSRESAHHKEDNLLDCLGYIALASDMHKKPDAPCLVEPLIGRASYTPPPDEGN